MNSTIQRYSASSLIKSIHEVPHLNENLQKISSVFDLSTSNLWNTYSQSLFALPVIMSSTMIFIIVIIYFILVCSRGLKLSNSKVKNENIETTFINPLTALISWNTNTSQKRDKASRICSPSITVLVITLGLVSILGLMSTHILFFGNVYLSRGISDIRHSLDNLSMVSTSLSDDGTSLLIESQVLSSIIQSAQSSCNEVSSVLPELSNIISDIDQYQSYVSPLPPLLSLAQLSLDTVISPSQYTQWIIYGLSIAIFVMYGVSIRRQSKAMIQFSLLFNGFISAVLFSMGCFLFAFLIGLADFCISPFDNLLSLISEQSTSHDIASYYVQCDGVNPLSSSLASASASVTSLSDAINTLLQSSCVNNALLLQAQDDIAVITSGLADIDTLSSCPPIQLEFNDMLSSGFCGDGFEGLFIVWLWLLLTATLCVIASVVVSIIHIYFGQYWNIDEDDHESIISDVNEQFNGYEKPNDVKTYVINPGAKNPRVTRDSSDLTSVVSKSLFRSTDYE